MLQSVEEHSQRMVALQAKTLKMRTEKRKLKKKKKKCFFRSQAELRPLRLQRMLLIYTWEQAIN